MSRIQLPNKGIDYYKKCEYCSKKFPVRRSLKKRGWNGVRPIIARFCSKQCGLILRNKSKEQKDAVSLKLKGRPSALIGRKRKKESVEKGRLKILGDKHWNWKGGISPKNAAQRSCVELKEWRREVFKRDKYTCKKCGYRGKGLEAHHKKSWAEYPESRFDIDNGETLCKQCNSETSNYRGKVIHSNR